MTRLLNGLLLLCLLATGACQHAPRPIATTQEQAAGSNYVPSPYEADILAFETADRLQPPPLGGIVFVGSSSIRLWPDLPQAFPGHVVVNRGFGGSMLPDVVQFAARIVVPLAPATVVIYAGDNDIGRGRMPSQVLADYRNLVRLLRRSLPEVRIVMVSIKPSPSRWALVERMREANELLAQEVARDPRATFVDVFTPMLGADGLPRPELYVADALHMSPAGYALWQERIAPAL
jgi:lysophospholipase L1-like esterase